MEKLDSIIRRYIDETNVIPKYLILNPEDKRKEEASKINESGLLKVVYNENIFINSYLIQRGQYHE